MLKLRKQRLFVENLEDRRLLAIMTAFDVSSGELSILLDGADDIALEAPSINLQLNGKDIDSGLRISDVDSIVITAVGDFANDIDLSSLDIPVDSLSIDAGGGDDRIGAPLIDMTLTGGDGDDTVDLATIPDGNHVTFVDAFVVNLAREFELGDDATITVLGNVLELRIPHNSNAVMREGSTIQSEGGDIRWSGEDTSMRMLTGASIKTFSGDITTTSVRMEPGSSIDSETGDITLFGSFGHEITHISTSAAVKIHTNRGAVFSLVSDAPAIHAKSLELNGVSVGNAFGESLNTAVSTLNGSVISIPDLINFGELNITELRAESVTSITTVPSVDGAEVGDIVFSSGEVFNSSISPRLSLNSSGSIVLPADARMGGLIGLNITVGKDLKFNERSSIGTQHLEVSGTAMQPHTIKMGSTIGANAGDLDTVSIRGGEMDDEIAFSSSILYGDRKALLDGKGGSDTYLVDISRYIAPTDIFTDVMTIDVTDTGPTSETDRLNIKVGKHPFTIEGSRLTAVNGAEKIIINYEGVEQVAVIRPGDIDEDGQVNDTDIDQLIARISPFNTDPHFDLNSDRVVTIQDAIFLVEDIIGTRFGDLDLDRRVTFDDFLSLSANFGREGDSVGWADGDLDGNDKVEFADFLKLSANFGFGTGL